MKIGKVTGHLTEGTLNEVSVLYDPKEESYDIFINTIPKSLFQQTFILDEGVSTVPYSSLVEMYRDKDAIVGNIKRANYPFSSLPKTLGDLVKPIHTILLDMDEVLVDFKKALVDCNPEYDVANMYEVASIFGNKEALVSTWISNTIKHSGFETAKPKDFFFTVKDYLLPFWKEKGIKVEILSSLSSNPAIHSEIASQKLKWLSKHNVDLPFTFVKGASNKQNYAKEGVLLIDDYYRNVTQFVTAGGYAILADPKRQYDSIVYKLELLGLAPDDI